MYWGLCLPAQRSPLQLCNNMSYPDIVDWNFSPYQYSQQPCTFHVYCRRYFSHTVLAPPTKISPSFLSCVSLCTRQISYATSLLTVSVNMFKNCSDHLRDSGLLQHANGMIQNTRGGGGGHSHSLNSTPAPQRTSYFNQTMGKVQLQCNKKNNAPLSLKVTPTFHNTYHIFKHKCKSFLSVHYVMQCDNVGMLEFFEQ